MAWTWEEILTDSLSLSGLLGQGQTVDAFMLSDAKRRASALLDELDGEGIALPVFSIDVDFVCVPTQANYVLGTGSDASPANAIRPETILTATVQIEGGSQPVYMTLAPISFDDYRKISTPQNQSQPFNYALNPKWPQADLYLYPAPSQEYPIKLTCKVRWIDVVTDPVTNPTSYAQLPSGYTNAFVNLLALRLAEWRRLDTDTLRSKASSGKYVMMTKTWDHVPDLDTQSADVFPWDIIKAGMNPQ